MNVTVKLVTGNHSEMERKAWEAVKDHLDDLSRLNKYAYSVSVLESSPKYRYKAARLFCLMNGIGGYYPVRSVARFVINFGKENQS
jgi:hypothetical protein